MIEHILVFTAIQPTSISNYKVIIVDIDCQNSSVLRSICSIGVWPQVLIQWTTIKHVLTIDCYMWFLCGGTYGCVIGLLSASSLTKLAARHTLV